MFEDRVELDVEEVREHEVTGENDDLLQKFLFKVYQQQTEKSAKRYGSGVDRYMAWLELMSERAERMDYPESPLDIGKRGIDDYFSWLANTEWGIETRKSYFSAVQRFYRWVNQTGRGDNITESYSIDDYTLEPGELEKNRQQTTNDDDYLWIPREEIELLWHPDYVPAPRTQYELAFKLMWYTTARAQAISDIKIENIDREDGEILIPNLKSGGHEPPYRTVIYPVDRIEPLLTEWLDRGKRDALSPYADESPYLFLTHQSEKLRSDRISRKVKWAAQNADINEESGTDVQGKTRWKVTAHCVRHSAITYLANQTTTPIHLVRRQAGHSQLSTTLSYVHDDDDAFRRELQNAWS